MQIELHPNIYKIQLAALAMNIANTNFKEPLIVDENVWSNYLSLLKIEIEDFTILRYQFDHVISSRDFW
jgi:hypothetical protein